MNHRSLRSPMTTVVVALALLLSAVTPVLAALDPSSWSDATHLTTRQDGTNPINGQYVSLAFDGNGVAVAVWRSRVTTHSLCTTCTSGEAFETWVSTRTDNVWSDPTPVPTPDGYFTSQDIEVITLADGDLLLVHSLQIAGGSAIELRGNRWDAASRSWDAGQWAMPISSTAFRSNSEFQLHATPGGAILIFDDKANNLRLSWVRYDAAADSWGSVNFSTSAVNLSREGLDAVVDDNGTAFVIFSDDDSDNVYGVAIDAADNETAVTLLDDTGMESGELSAIAQLQPFSTGAALGWKNGNDELMYTETEDGSSWMTPIALGDAGDGSSLDSQPALAIDADGNVTYLAQRDSAPTDGTSAFISKTSDGRPGDGGGWPAEWTIHSDETGSNAEVDYSDSVTTSQGHVVFVMFTSSTGGVPQIDLLVRKRTGTWLDPIPVSIGPANELPSLLRLAIDADDRPALAWNGLGSTSVQQVNASNDDTPLRWEDPQNGPSSPAAAPRFECRTGPTLTVEQAGPLAIGGSSVLTVTVSNPHSVVQGKNDVLISLADGLSAETADPTLLNLGSRVALQGLELNPAATSSFTLTVSSGDQLVAQPEYAAEVYCGGRVIQSTTAEFSGPIAADWTTIVAGGLPAAAGNAGTGDAAPAVPAAPAAPPALPVTLPNTAALPSIGGWLLAAAGVSTAAGLLLRRRN